MSKDTSIFSARSGYELRVIGELSDIWPFQSPDKLVSAAMAMDTFKKKMPELWEGFQEHLKPKVAADIIVDIILSENRNLYKKADHMRTAGNLEAKCRAPVDLDNISSMQMEGKELVIKGKAKIWAVDPDGSVYGDTTTDYVIYMDPEKKTVLKVEVKDPFLKALVVAAAKSLPNRLLAEQRNYLR